MDELKAWLLEQATAIEEQHSTLGNDRLVLQGRHEAVDFVLQKIAALTSVEAEALEATASSSSESSEASEQEG